MWKPLHSLWDWKPFYSCYLLQWSWKKAFICVKTMAYLQKNVFIKKSVEWLFSYCRTKLNDLSLKLQKKTTLVLARYLQKLAGSRCFYFLCTKRTQWRKSLWSMQRLHCAQHVTWKAKLARIWVVSFFLSFNFFSVKWQRVNQREEDPRWIEQTQKNKESKCFARSKQTEWFNHLKK